MLIVLNTVFKVLVSPNLWESLQDYSMEIHGMTSLRIHFSVPDSPIE